MNKKALLIIPALLMFLSLQAVAQGSYMNDQRRQETMIRKAYKRHRVTRNEYQKLMNEQDAIKYAIRKYRRDGVITLHEQNVIEGKLNRAEDRLRRYKTNWER